MTTATASGLRAKALAAHADAELHRQQTVYAANLELWALEAERLTTIVADRFEVAVSRIIEPTSLNYPADAVVETDGVLISFNKGGRSSCAFHAVMLCPVCGDWSDNGARVDGLTDLGTYLTGTRDICLACFDNLTDADMLAEVLEGRR